MQELNETHPQRNTKSAPRSKLEQQFIISNEYICDEEPATRA